jgi:drug/metabolite transporter (DMT)-like permease
MNRVAALRSGPARSGLGVAAIFLASLAGISFAAIFVRLALPAPPVVTGLYRMLFATLLLGAWLLFRRERPAFRPGAAAAALAAGACLGLDLAMWHTSIVLTSVAMATLLVNTTPLYVGLWAALVERVRFEARFLLGALLALAGTGLLLGFPRASGEDWRGAALALAAALCYAGYLLLVRAARRESGDGTGAGTVPLLFLTSASATATLAVAAGLRGDPFAGFPAHAWGAMLGAAVLSQLGGQMGVIWSLRWLPATVTSVALLAQPVGTALLGWWLLGEPIAAIEATGGAAVLAGIALASRSALTRTSAPSTRERSPACPSRPSS